MTVLQPSTNKVAPPFKRLKPNPLPTTRYATLQREHNFRHPSTSGPHFPEAHKLIRPHIDSFDTLFDHDGLLEQGIKDLDEKVIFDGKATEARPFGNKLTSRPTKKNYVQQ